MPRILYFALPEKLQTSKSQGFNHFRLGKIIDEVNSLRIRGGTDLEKVGGREIGASRAQ